VLKALLPPRGTDIKVQKTYDQLHQQSGSAAGRQEFDDLLKLLNSDLRLITPKRVEHLGSGSRETSEVSPDPLPTSAENWPSNPTELASDTSLAYEIAHDDLIDWLRNWLTRKQIETRRGRAELCLAERAALWNAKPETREQIEDVDAENPGGQLRTHR
jgi:hypothetical protein